MFSTKSRTLISVQKTRNPAISTSGILYWGSVSAFLALNLGRLSMTTSICGRIHTSWVTRMGPWFWLYRRHASRPGGGHCTQEAIILAKSMHTSQTTEHIWFALSLFSFCLVWPCLLPLSFTMTVAAKLLHGTTALVAALSQQQTNGKCSLIGINML